MACDPKKLNRRPAYNGAAYFGGKFRLASKYISLFPSHSVYVESFGGSGVVLLNKPKSKVEVYNDLEEGVYSFFACLRDEALSGRLVQQLELTPYSRQEHEICVSNYDASADVVEKARRWYVACQASYSSILGEQFRIAVTKSCGDIWKNRIDRLQPIIERMRSVTVERLDFETVLRKYDSEDTLHFIDPPYVLDTRVGGGYRHELSDADHERLMSVIKSLRGAVMICGHPHPMYERALDGWLAIDTPSRSTSGTTRRNRIERIWMNYRLREVGD